MARIARVVVPEVPHHITQRGNNRQDVFFTDDDRRLYLRLLAEKSERFGLRILAYCLMTNHIHLVAIPMRPDSLAKAVGRTHFDYTQAINRRRERSGHLWQNRFFSCALERERVGAAIRYVERNPRRAKLVREPWRYPWSSAQAHVTGEDETGMLDLTEFRLLVGDGDWRDWLRIHDHATEVDRLRTHTRCGRPMGSGEFVQVIEAAQGRRLTVQPPGRPRSN